MPGRDTAVNCSREINLRYSCYIPHFDLKPLISEGGIFSKLEDDKFFCEALTVLNDTVAWDVSGCFDSKNYIDIDPFVLYESQMVSDPLEEVG